MDPGLEPRRIALPSPLGAQEPPDSTDACAAPNSSGPNSSINDNCAWTIMPGFAFDTITISAYSCGTVALEGGNDFGTDPANDSLFYVSNRAPVTTNDTYSTPEDTQLTGNVLANDNDPDGNPISATLGTSTTHGQLTFAADGSFTLYPLPAPKTGEKLYDVVISGAGSDTVRSCSFPASVVLQISPIRPISAVPTTASASGSSRRSSSLYRWARQPATITPSAAPSTATQVRPQDR